MDDYTIVSISMCCAAFLFYFITLTFGFVPEPLLYQDGQPVYNLKYGRYEYAHPYKVLLKGCFLALTVIALLISIIMSGIINKTDKAKSKNTNIDGYDITAYIIIGFCLILFFATGSWRAYPGKSGKTTTDCGQGPFILECLGSPLPHHLIQGGILFIMGFAAVILIIKDI